MKVTKKVDGVFGLDGTKSELRILPSIFLLLSNKNLIHPVIFRVSRDFMHIRCPRAKKVNAGGPN